MKSISSKGGVGGGVLLLRGVRRTITTQIGVVGGCNRKHC